MINSFMNPLFLLRIAKNYLSDLNRIWNFDEKQMKEYQDKIFRRLVKYAYTVPVYHDKYKLAKINPNEIRSVNDIVKLPFISKEDLRINYPDRIISKGFDQSKNYLLSSSGSTGKPVFIYIDAFSAVKSLIAFVRSLRAYGGDWQKTKIVLVIDTTHGSLEQTVFNQSTLPFLNKFMSLNNIKYIDNSKNPKDVIDEINKFQPEILGSDPNILRELAFLKNNGSGKDIKLNCIVSGGAMLDDYTKRYVKNSFNTQVTDTYATTESGPIAFKCLNEDLYHVHSDFVYLEFLDKYDKPIPTDSSGRIVVTKLYGNGTPIIRYKGIEDFVIHTTKKTKCNLSSQNIKKIEGRSTDIIILPDNRLFSPLSITGIPALVMEYFNTYKIKQFQIVQNEINEIEILIVIDDKLRNKGPSVKIIFDELKKRFSEKIGKDVKIAVREVDEIKKEDNLDYVKLVVSKISDKML